MKENDFRLGNFVNDRGGKLLRIDFFEHLQEGISAKFGQRMFLEGQEVHALTEYSDYAQPITITEEWHNKFGVQKNGFGSFEYILPRSNHIDIKVVFTGDYIMLSQGIGASGKDIISIWNKDVTRREMYVHEWQNLYFALTGEELTIKEDESN